MNHALMLLEQKNLGCGAEEVQYCFSYLIVAVRPGCQPAYFSKLHHCTLCK